MPGVRFLALLDGPVGARAACSHRPLMDVIIMTGWTPIVDDAASILVWPEVFAHGWLVWSGRQVRPWCSYDLLFGAQRL